MPADSKAIETMLARIHLFRGVDEITIESVAKLMEPVEFKSGTVIFKEGDDPDYFYFVFRGRLRMFCYRRQTGQNEQIGLLEEEDYFGHEVLESNWSRQITVEAVSDVDLVRVSVQQFIKVLEIIPEMAQRLQMILDSYRLMLSTGFVWMDPDETIEFISRRHVLFLVGRIAPPLIFGALTIPFTTYFFISAAMTLIPISFLMGDILITLAWLAWAYVDWTNDYYIVTNKRVLYQERVILLYDSRLESQLENIQSTSIGTSQLGRILRYGNVAIRTYIGTILFKDIPYPEQVMALIQEEQLRAQIIQRSMELREIKNKIEDHIRTGPKYPEPPKPPKPAPKEDSLREFLSTMFHLRYEKGPTIMFRTHWFILLTKIWIPTLLLIGLGMLLLLSVFYQFPVLSASATCSLTFIMFLFVFTWWFYQYMDWHNDVYLITPDQVVDVNKKPLGRESRQAAPLKNILSIEYKRLGIIGQIFNYGTVYIRVGDQQLTFDNVLNPSEVQRELFHKLSERNHNERMRQAEAEQDRLADWFASYHDIRDKDIPQENNRPARGGF